jgi:hypothetical protein
MPQQALHETFSLMQTFSGFAACGTGIPVLAPGPRPVRQEINDRRLSGKGFLPFD